MKRLSKIVAPMMTAATLFMGVGCEASPQAAAKDIIDRNLHATSATIARGLLARIATHNAEGVPNSIGSHLEVTKDGFEPNPQHSDKRLIIGNGALMLSGAPAQSITVEVGTTDGKPDPDKVTYVGITATVCMSDIDPSSCKQQVVGTIDNRDGLGWIAQEATYPVPYGPNGREIVSTHGKTDVGLAQNLAGDIIAKTLTLMTQP